MSNLIHRIAATLSRFSQEAGRSKARCSFPTSVIEALETRTLLMAYLLRDINTVPVTLGSNPSGFLAVGTTVFFTASNATTGEELWKSDGTASGTVLVKDLTSDSGGSNPSGMTLVGNLLYVTATTKTVGTELFALNVSNSTPTILNLSDASIAENNLLNAVIGTFTTADPDVGDTFTYSLVPGTGSTGNAAFTIDGVQLKANASFDFETKSS